MVNIEQEEETHDKSYSVTSAWKITSLLQIPIFNITHAACTDGHPHNTSRRKHQLEKTATVKSNNNKYKEKVNLSLNNIIEQEIERFTTEELSMENN